MARRFDYPLTMWFLGTSIGVLIILGNVFGWLGMTAIGLLVIPLARRESGAWAVAGALTSFGAMWLFLMWFDTNASSGQLDNAIFWFLVGLVPLAIGLAWTAALATAAAHRVKES